jgi:hypothetical protein
MSSDLSKRLAGGHSKAIGETHGRWADYRLDNL